MLNDNSKMNLLLRILTTYHLIFKDFYRNVITQNSVDTLKDMGIQEVLLLRKEKTKNQIPLLDLQEQISMKSSPQASITLTSSAGTYFLFINPIALLSSSVFRIQIEDLPAEVVPKI